MGRRSVGRRIANPICRVFPHDADTADRPSGPSMPDTLNFLPDTFASSSGFLGLCRERRRSARRGHTCVLYASVSTTATLSHTVVALTHFPQTLHPPILLPSTTFIPRLSSLQKHQAARVHAKTDAWTT